MNIKFNQSQGRTLYEQLQQLKNEATGKSETTGKKEATKEKSSEKSGLPVVVEDKLDLSENANVYRELSVSEERSSERSHSTKGELEASNGAKVSFQFDLFYSLASKVEAKMGQNGAERFVSLGASVAETFKSSFNLQIDGIGSFMNGTEKSLDISPEVANDFFNAIEGLTQQGPEALENFLQKSDAFFDELEATYGSLDGAFDTIKEQVQSQAKEFMASVGDAKDFIANGFESDKEAIMAEAQGAIGEAEKPDNGEAEMIQMKAKPEISIPKVDYKEFLDKFLEYAKKMEERMLKNWMSINDKMAKDSDKSIAEATKSLLDISA